MSDRCDAVWPGSLVPCNLPRGHKGMHQHLTPPAPPGLDQQKDFKALLLALGQAYENWHVADRHADESPELGAHRLRCKVRYEKLESLALAALQQAEARVRRETKAWIVKAVQDKARSVLATETIFADERADAFNDAADFIETLEETP